MHRIESGNALNARLGNILIQSVSAKGKLLGVPTKLLKIWRESEAKGVPAALGGEKCEKVIAAYQEGGLEAVAKLLSSITAPVIKANAYTALARHLRHGQPAKAAEVARLAYEEDPRPFRLKWLAFRLYESGKISEAEAMLSLLPKDIQFSDSEARQADQVRYEAQSARLREARQRTGFESRRQAIENQLKQLGLERDKQARLAAERQAQLEQLTQAKAAVELELGREIEALKQVQAEREQEIALLEQARDQQARLAEERQTANEALAKEKAELAQAKAQLEQEKSVLAGRHEEQAKLAAERLKQINELQQQIQSRQANEAELAARQQMMHEEMVRAEAQLDLIKDMLLREPEL